MTPYKGMLIVEKESIITLELAQRLKGFGYESDIVTDNNIPEDLTKYSAVFCGRRTSSDKFVEGNRVIVDNKDTTPRIIRKRDGKIPIIGLNVQGSEIYMDIGKPLDEEDLIKVIEYIETG